MKVEIYGQSYNIAGDLDSVYVEELAQHVDAKMRDIAQSTGMVDSVKIAVLAALSIADELHTLKQSRENKGSDLRDRAERCIQLIEQALAQSA